jgi:hypothetical protein
MGEPFASGNGKAMQELQGTWFREAGFIGEYVLVTPGGLEPPAYGLGNRRSILLSYGVAPHHCLIFRSNSSGG